MKEGAALGSAWASALGHVWTERDCGPDRGQDGLRGTMKMRKSCRWLGCAALLCFTAVELSGCTSKPLISGMKWPSRKDRDSAFASKDKPLTAEQSEDLLAQARDYEQDENYPQAARAYREYLNGGGEPVAQNRRATSQGGKSDKKTTAKETQELLAQAREYEKAGDFPKAAQAYRQYLNGGEPVETNRRAPSQQVAQADKKSREASADFAKTDSDVESPVRQTSKSKQPAPKRPQTTQNTAVDEDPWADATSGRPHSDALPVIKPNPPARPLVKREPVVTEQQSLLDEDTAPSESPVWADPDSVDQSATDDESLAAESHRPAPRGLSEEDLEDLLDLDEGEIDWGDAPVQPQTVAVEETLSEPAESFESPEAESPTDLPLVDLSADESEIMGPPEQAEDLAPESEAENEAWHSHESGPESTTELAMTEAVEPTLPAQEEFSPPVLSDIETESEVMESPETESLSLSCKDCEPWLYAQVMKLESSDVNIRKEGLTHLADMGSTARQAGPAVRTLLEDPDPLVRAHAAWALWVIENDPWDSVATLRPLLDYSHADVVELSCYMLGDIGVQAESATDALELLRDHADGTTRIHAAEALIRIHGVDDKSLTVLTTAAKSRDGEERWIAAVALGRCRGPKSERAVTTLAAALRDVDPEVRCAAALSLGGLGQDAVKAQPELERVARTDEAQVRDAAKAALACLKR